MRLNQSVFVPTLQNKLFFAPTTTSASQVARGGTQAPSETGLIAPKF